MRLAQEWPTALARKTVVSEINKGNFTAARWWLERKASAEFGQTPATGKHPEPAINLTQAQWDAMQQASEAAIRLLQGEPDTGSGAGNLVD